MKCFVLAGGSGDALWPLSRRNYPKQFFHMHSGRSPFQEAIARNLPFCDEFWILTGLKYENIVISQLSIFQGLKYKCILEQEGHQTAPIVALACMDTDSSEDFIVVSCDHVIGRGDYNGVIITAQRALAQSRMKDESIIVAIGCGYGKNGAGAGHNFFDVYDDGQVEFNAYGVHDGGCETFQGDLAADRGMERFADSGIFLINSSDYLKAVKQNAPALYEQCLKVHKKGVIASAGRVEYSAEDMKDVPFVTIGDAVYRAWSQQGRVKVIPADFEWERLLSLEQVAALWENDTRLTLINDAQNVHVINQSDSKLIVVNGVSDIMVTNDSDAVYITSAGSSSKIKDIIANNDSEILQPYFDEGDVFYTPWGCKETLTRGDGYRVKKLTVLPGHMISLHKHKQRSEHLSVVSGIATIILDGTEKEYKRNESILIPIGSSHQIKNVYAKDLVMIEVSMGESINAPGTDMIRQSETAAEDMPAEKTITEEKLLSIIRLKPVFKDYLWGGRRMKDVFGWNVPFDTFAESWLLSAHRDGISDVCIPEGGTMAFDHFLGEIGRERLGWKSQPYERFPMLVKFIDACQSLSVQVHPADTYALEHENDYGKNEMWYIMEADDDAFVYLGFERDTSPGEVRERIAEGTLTEILHKVPVKKGDSVMVPAGTVHAIGAGILILEVQQSSNATYRLYDYKRKGSDGKYRELHIDKALANMDYSRCNDDAQPSGAWEDMRGFRKIMLQQCKYFSVSRIMVSSAAEIVMDVSTFYSLVIIDGSGVIETELTDGPLAGQIAAREDFKVGDSFFIPAGNKIIRINGKCDMILSHI